MNLSRVFKGWNSCTKKQKLCYIEQFLGRLSLEHPTMLTHSVLDDLVMVFWNEFHEEEEDQ